MDLRNKDSISREDIMNLLKSLGAPGENRELKRQAVIDLNKENFQGISLVDDLESYEDY